MLDMLMGKAEHIKYISLFEITTIDALTLVSALLPLLVAFAIILQTPRLAALAAFLVSFLLGGFSFHHVLAVDALAIHSANVPVAETLTIS